MLFIHGGGYSENSATDWVYGPDFLVENRIILVTINYRLGVLGFLSLDLPEYSGNMALKDQQLAMQWTHENVGRFGGDAERITIFGQSAGATSAHFQVMSAESQKYFGRAILMSGSALHLWAYSPLADHVERAFEMARRWNRPQTNVTELVDLLKSVPARDFIEASRNADEIERTATITLSPVIERELLHS